MNLAERDAAVIWHPYTNHFIYPLALPIVKAEGVYLYDDKGRKIIDAISSWWVNIHGHSHPYIAEKVHEQLLNLEHVIFAGFTHLPAIELAERLLKILPGGHSKIFYSDNGSTAVEVALKMALQYWYNKNEPRKKIIAFSNSYHGDTFGVMSLGSRGAFSKPFEELLFDVIHIPVPTKENKKEILLTFNRIIAENKHEIAAFVFEPLVLGAGGMVIYDAEELNELILLCKENGIVTIADEVMTGFGRLGKMFATNYLKSEVDIICLSKGITGGTMALGVTSCKEFLYQEFKINDRYKTFFHGHSFTANPIACAASLASLDLFEQNNVFEKIKMIEQNHQQFVIDISNYANVLNPRSIGTIAAFEIAGKGKDSYFNEIRDKAYFYFLKKGILLRPMGNTIYILPPYCITEAELKFIYSTIIDFLTTDV
ncbi:MAG: adenosylmethionine--8-amino-7-oxononanoate transaminase [Bacteroidetes bacterium]|nr:adenosylmethionine--8-amino-7-oxononanoate transaminase [Bacteroidota bacterium]